MRIAESPLKRAEAFSLAEQSLRASAGEKGIAGEQMDAFIELQMKAIRQMVLDLDVGGRPEGGRA
jgi:hypothetical protein